MKNLFLVLCLSMMSVTALAQFGGPGRGGPGRGGDWRDDRGPGSGGHGGGGSNGRSTICFFEDINYRGQSLCVEAGQRLPNLVQNGWNDRISSVAIYGRVSVTVYQDINFGGQSLTISQNTPDIRSYGAYWNDFISSFVVNGGGGGFPPPPPPPPPRPPQGRVCFFRDINYSGNSFCMQPGQVQANLVSLGWNDEISSVSVEGDASVVLYQDINYGGQSILINRSASDLRAYNWNDLASSLNVLRANGRQ